MPSSAGICTSYERLTEVSAWGSRGTLPLFPLYYANRVIQEMIRPQGTLVNEWGSAAALVGYSVLLLLASRTLRDVE